MSTSDVRAGGKTFVRVVHLATGKDRVVVGLDGASSNEVATRLTQELASEIDSERVGRNPLPDLPNR